MGRKVRIIAGILITCILTVSGLYYLTGVMEKKDSKYKYGPFFAEENDFDVLFLGTSHVINGIFPMELWHEYGITSYNLGGHGNTMATTYWTFMNALDYTNPKVVVLDCYFVSNLNKLNSNIDYMHLSLDAFPMTWKKLRAVNDLFDTRDDKFDFIWSFGKFHTRWNSLEENDFVPEYTIEKGAESRVAVAIPNAEGKLAREDKAQAEGIGFTYLDKIVQECEKRGIKIIFTYLPCPADASMQREANVMYDIAQTYDIPYINFLDDSVTHFYTDFYDDTSHLNPSGAKKVTSRLGAYIQENCGVEDKRTNSKYASWNEDYNAYAQYKKQLIQEQDDVYSYLMLLADQDIQCKVYLRKDSDLVENERIISLIANCSDYDLDFFDRETLPQFYDDNRENNYLKDMSGAMDIAIIVVDKDTEEIIDISYFYIDPVDDMIKRKWIINEEQ